MFPEVPEVRLIEDCLDCSLENLSDSSTSGSPGDVRPSQYKQYSPEDRTEAKLSKQDPSETARQTGVPRTTILRDRKQAEERADTRRYLQAEHEEQLLAWILATYKAGFPASDRCVKEKAAAMMERLGVPRRGRMKKWLEEFKQRHSKQFHQIPLHYRHAAAEKALSEESLNEFYARLEWYIKKYKLTAQDIWNMDETGSEMLGSILKVWAPKNAHTATTKALKDKQHMTIVGTIRADGWCIPPLSIVKGTWKTIPRVWRFDGAPEGMRVAHTRKRSSGF